jgi:glycosyltransferase involved in cell wall biosynthesis
MSLSGARVALIQDFLVHMRGAERVLLTLSDIFPDADIFALVGDPELIATQWPGRRVVTSFVDRLPRARSSFRLFLPLYPHAVERFDLTAYDLVVSNTMGFAHGVITQPRTCHISVCLSPFRFAWSYYHEYLGARSPLQNILLQPLLRHIREWDRHASARVDQYIAISKVTQQRILKFYGRESHVLHPPIDGSAFSIADRPDDFYLIVSGLVPYKRLDIAVQAFSRLRLPLKIIGSGPDAERLKAMAGPTVELLGWRSDSEVREAYARCRAFVMTADEDYGLTPLEALASGRPVIAYGAGGALETVRDGVTGIFYNRQTVESLIEATRRFETRAFDPATLREHALQFDLPAFERRLLDFVGAQLTSYRARYGLPPRFSSAP